MPINSVNTNVIANKVTINANIATTFQIVMAILNPVKDNAKS
ncbi:hypothetical protein FMO003_18600 [Moritella sp. F3]|nr:hypothetical protein FMO001_07660 [Moritella sp. F1]GIC81579.1 hypothetical protein FMO003_18600 [Moritella sp. F3]